MATLAAGRDAIRAVVVDEPTGWVAFFCTDPTASAADVLGAVADRFRLETTRGDLPLMAVVGADRVSL